MTSLRGKLILGMLTGLTLLIAAGGAVTYLNIKRRLEAESDRALIQRAALLAAMIEAEQGHIQIDWLEQENYPPGHLQGVDYFAVWEKASGRRLAASPELEEDELPRFGGSLAQPELRDVRLPGDRLGRCVSLEFDARRDPRNEDDAPDDREEPALLETPLPPGPVWIQLVLAKTDTVNATLASIRRPLTGLWLGCTGLGALLIWGTVRRALRPLDQLRRQIAQLGGEAGDRRVTLPGEPLELAPVTAELNRLLDRVDRALVRERTLTSNVAHELRTPIAGVLSILEVTLSRLRSAEEYRESTEECFEIAKRMHWLINNLLSITRIESGSVQLHRHPLVLPQALPEWWQPFAARAEARRLRIEWALDPAARLETDPEFLRVVVSNLYDNAVSYATEGGTVQIAADASGNISVANQALAFGAPPERPAPDPLGQGDSASDLPAGVHAGLGLNLCQKIVEVLGGRMSTQTRESEEWFVVRLEMA